MLEEFERDEIVEKIIELGKKFPNDQVLGKKFRLAYGTIRLAKSVPNDFDLGRKIRKAIFEKSK